MFAVDDGFTLKVEGSLIYGKKIDQWAVPGLSLSGISSVQTRKLSSVILLLAEDLSF